MNANVFKPAMAALVVAIAATGLVACNGTGDKSEPVSKVTAPPTTASVAEPATPTPSDSKANASDTTAIAPDTMAKAGDVVEKGTSEATPPENPSTLAQPAASSPPMTAQQESNSMPIPGQANDHSAQATQPIPKN